MTSSGHLTFLSIPFDRKEIETWERCQSVRLIKTHHLICIMTYLGRFVILTSGDLRSNLQIDLSRSKTHQSIWIDERNTVVSKLFPELM